MNRSTSPTSEKLAGAAGGNSIVKVPRTLTGDSPWIAAPAPTCARATIFTGWTKKSPPMEIR
ncbi:MAG: hypothetical protein U0S48_05220 [Solirubrobacteraceae bacterium]